MTNTFEITNVAPSASLGRAVVEGYINEETEFCVTIYTSNHVIDYVTLNDEIVWSEKPATHPDDRIDNPIDTALFEELKSVVRNNVRTIRARN